MIRINDKEIFSSKLPQQKPEKIFNKGNDYHEGLNQNHLLKMVDLLNLINHFYLFYLYGFFHI